jgi:hypothetical protein
MVETSVPPNGADDLRGNIGRWSTAPGTPVPTGKRSLSGTRLPLALLNLPLRSSARMARSSATADPELRHRLRFDQIALLTFNAVRRPLDHLLQHLDVGVRTVAAEHADSTARGSSSVPPIGHGSSSCTPSCGPRTGRAGKRPDPRRPGPLPRSAGLP